MGLILTDKTREYYMAKSIQENFDNVLKRKPNASSYLCFAEAISGKKIKRSILRKWFKELVSRDDYGYKEERGTFEYLYLLSHLK